MNITITSYDQPSIVLAMLLASLILVGLLVIGIAHWMDKREKSASEYLWPAGIVILLVGMLSPLAAAMIQEENAKAEAQGMITDMYYEQYDVANLTLSGEDYLHLSPLLCHPEGPEPKNRPIIDVEWVDREGQSHSGSLTNLGNIAGECELVLAAK